MGCGSSQPKARPPRAFNDDPPIDPITVPEWVNSYPPPKPPLDRKEDIFDESQYVELDRKAALVPSNFESYESLIDVLTKDCTTDVETARAIFVWLFHQNIFDTCYPGIKDPHTPQGYMKLIKTANGTYESFFALLCRAANIPCAVVQGMGKGNDYLVGQNTTEGMGSTCNAVYLSGSWRLLHIGWAYLNEKLNHVDPNSLESQVIMNGTKRLKINEFFWLTDPSKMINFCFPKVKSWQLLDPPQNLNLFLHSPHLTEDYFTSGLTVSNELKAIVTSKHGVCSVKFDHNPKNVHNNNIQLSGRLRRQNDSSNIADSVNDYIITTGRESSKELFIRFPDKGVYYLDVHGGENNQTSLITRFRLDCTEVRRPVHPFPLRPDNGFTVLPNLQDFGVSSIKPANSVVYVKPKSMKEFHLALSKDLHIDAKMFHVNKDLGSLDQFLEVVSDLEGGQVWVKIAVPDEPHVEYALQIRALDPSSNKNQYVTIATYLLVHNSWPHPPSKGKPQTVVEEADDKRRKLQDATKTGDMDELEEAIKEFKSSNLEDQGDLTRALNVLLLMHLDNLRTATESRSLKEISAAIVNARKSCLADVVERTQEMEEARSAQRQLLQIKLILHKILELKPRTITEIHSYPRPRSLVHNVMRATYRILGEPAENVESWPAVKALLKEIGLNSIINRIKRFDIFYMTDEEAEDAQTFLGETNRYAVRIVSAGAGTFFTWSKNVLGQYQTISQEMRSRKTTKLSLMY